MYFFVAASLVSLGSVKSFRGCDENDLLPKITLEKEKSKDVNYNRYNRCKLMESFLFHPFQYPLK